MMGPDLFLRVFATLTFAMMMRMFLVRHYRLAMIGEYSKNKKDQLRHLKQQQKKNFQQIVCYQPDFQELKNHKIVKNRPKQKDSK